MYNHSSSVCCICGKSLAECIVSVSKNKFTSFHLGLALQMFWFFVCSTFHRCNTQKSCGYTWELYLVVMMVGDISQFKICVARFLISHVRFYLPFTLLLDVTLPLLFSELGKICALLCVASVESRAHKEPKHL
jgi:hypothetical protein